MIWAKTYINGLPCLWFPGSFDQQGAVAETEGWRRVRSGICSTDPLSWLCSPSKSRSSLCLKVPVTAPFLAPSILEVVMAPYYLPQGTELSFVILSYLSHTFVMCLTSSYTMTVCHQLSPGTSMISPKLSLLIGRRTTHQPHTSLNVSSITAKAILNMTLKKLTLSPIIV